MGSFFVAQDEVNDSVENDMSDWYANIASTTFSISSSDNTYYKLTASTVKVNDKSTKDPNYFATYSQDNTDGVAKYDIVEKLLTLQSDTSDYYSGFRGNDAESFLETLLSDITIDVNKVEISSNNYSNIATVISTQRTSVSGVDEDEEALNLVKFQNAYNLASKVISVMAEMYDKLIEETGVT
jgi:flagellar hook-associated protein 1 FlgK